MSAFTADQYLQLRFLPVFIDMTVAIKIQRLFETYFQMLNFRKLGK